MKKFFLYCYCFLPVFLHAQSYYYEINQGVDPSYNPWVGGAAVMGPGNDFFSNAQTLPFAWNFYGTAVTQYYISDNGYITFEAGPTTSYSNNTIIPDPAGPNNSIYACWSSLEISNYPAWAAQQCRSYTLGTTPDRVHVIQFETVRFSGWANYDYLFFAVRIYEGGDFDIIHQLKGVTTGTVSATVGCENAAGTSGTMVNGSPNFDYPLVQLDPYRYDEQIVYTFHYGTQPVNEVLIHNSDLPFIVHTNSNYNIGAEVVNQGSSPITSLDIEYSIDGNTPVTANISGLNIPTYSSATITHPTTWAPTGPGNYADVSLRITAVNTMPDANPANDTVNKTVWVNLGNTGSPHVLVEQFCTVQCPYCPGSDLNVQSLADTFGTQVIPVNHHSGFGTDGMNTGFSTAISDEFTGFNPTACIDRVKWPGEMEIASTHWGGTNWREKVDERLLIKRPVDISFTTSWNAVPQLLTVNVDLSFVDYPAPGDLRMNVFAVENNVTGTGSGYDQYNYYNGQVGHPYYQAGNPIAGYVHDYVPRSTGTGSWGDTTIFTSMPGPGSNYSKSYTLFIPNGCDINEINVVAFVSYYDATKEMPDVLNAFTKEALLSSDRSNESFFEFELWPNPATNNAYTRFEITSPSEVSMDLFDIAGKKISAIIEGENFFPGKYSRAFSLEGIPAGVYFVEMMMDGKRAMRKLVVGD